MRSHTKPGPYQFSHFDVYLIQTNRKTDKQSIYILEFQGALRPSFKALRALRAHLLFQLLTCSLCVHCKQNRIFCKFHEKNRGFSRLKKILQEKKLLNTIFLNFDNL